MKIFAKKVGWLQILVFAMLVIGVLSQDGGGGGGSQKRRKLRKKPSDNPLSENSTNPLTDHPLELNPSPPDDQILALNETQLGTSTTERESRG